MPLFKTTHPFLLDDFIVIPRARNILEKTAIRPFSRPIHPVGSSSGTRPLLRPFSSPRGFGLEFHFPNRPAFATPAAAAGSAGGDAAADDDDDLRH